jgi:hypothetical protein
VLLSWKFESGQVVPAKAALANPAEVVGVRDPKTAKKPYRAPSFEPVDAITAKAELEEKGITQEARNMLSLIDQSLDRRTPAHRFSCPRKPRP